MIFSRCNASKLSSTLTLSTPTRLLNHWRITTTNRQRCSLTTLSPRQTWWFKTSWCNISGSTISAFSPLPTIAIRSIVSKTSRLKTAAERWAIPDNTHASTRCPLESRNSYRLYSCPLNKLRTRVRILMIITESVDTSRRRKIAVTAPTLRRTSQNGRGFTAKAPLPKTAKSCCSSDVAVALFTRTVLGTSISWIFFSTKLFVSILGNPSSVACRPA
mmetsp:Transcript_977/g.1183  ORF Transcript_977/g.1183 Transcript_977/m.1183 type:complete len:217 (+) Transcript_977:6846-7496(+)